MSVTEYEYEYKGWAVLICLVKISDNCANLNEFEFYIQGVFFPGPPIKRLKYENIGFPYFNLFRGGPVKKHPVHLFVAWNMKKSLAKSSIKWQYSFDRLAVWQNVKAMFGPKLCEYF